MMLERDEGEEGEEEEEGALGVRALSPPHASASAVSLLPAVVAATVQIQMDRARRLHLRQAGQHHARGLDLRSEEGDLRGRLGSVL